MSTAQSSFCQTDHDATEALAAWAKKVRAEAETPFAAAQQLAARLGAHYDENGRTTVGFWVPELVKQGIAAEKICLQVLRPLDPIDFQADVQTVRFRQERHPLVLVGECAWGVFTGLKAGRRDQVGDFYGLAYRDDAGTWQTRLDPLAVSVPFGGKAPAELYDLSQMHAERKDKAYFDNLETEPDPDGRPRVIGPTNILQIHVNTASAEGTLAGLTRIYETITAKQEAGETLTPGEHNYIGYDAVQLMPIEPTIEYEAGPAFWEVQKTEEEGETAVATVQLRRPDMTNWGYDVLTVASPAPNPCVLDSKRPDEFVDFLAALHNFPGQPIKVILDVVYGHTDNQTLPLLNAHYFAGANMYGQNLNYKQPLVRAILLEMQKRKNAFGVDGVRVDGAQDFKWWDAANGVMRHDDDYLRLMNDVEQEVLGQRYRAWMIFEDGRPWPRADWELASTYREVTKQLPNVVQWGPLTFAHNTPFLFTFWISKWWRIREIMDAGSHWITGCANHDTLRRGTQVDPEARMNTYLGDTLPQIFKKAYDNPAAKLFDYAMSPGIPMDFINAAMRAPWSFIRNTDDRYGVKVVSEEAYFLDWAVTLPRYEADFAFPRLKKLGFSDLNELRRFLRALDHAVKITAYSLETIASLLQAVDPPLPGPRLTPASLKQIARAWMDDVHEYCNVSNWQAEVDDTQSRFNLAVREFRRKRPWLRDNLGPHDYFNYRHPTDGAIVFYGLRQASANGEQILFVANMEGAPHTLTPADLPIPHLAQDGWQVALTTPDLNANSRHEPLTLADSQGVVFVKRDA